MSTPEEKFNNSESSGEQNDIIPQTDDLNKEASIFPKPPKEPYIDEESTIFTTTKSNSNSKAVVDSGKKRIARIIISVVVVLALLGSIFAITKFIPSKTDIISSETSSTGLFSIPVIAADSKNAESVSVKNSVGSFNLYSEEVESTSSDTSSTSSGTLVCIWC